MQLEKWDFFTVNSTMLAQAVGVTRGTIWRWTQGISRPTRRHQEKLEGVLEELAPLVLPELRSKDRELTLAENERSFRQTAQLVSDGWLPPRATGFPVMTLGVLCPFIRLYSLDIQAMMVGLV